jgi:hypothetical protein
MILIRIDKYLPLAGLRNPLNPRNAIIAKTFLHSHLVAL